MGLAATPELWFLPFALVIGAWVFYSDLATMKIPNKAVLALGAVFLVIGLLALPLTEYPWRLLHIVVVLVAGFAVNMAGMVGAGDAKFAAVMAPFVPLADARLFLVLFAAVLLAAYLTHRLFRAAPAMRQRTADWESWTAGKKFPMGLALAGALAFYLALGVWFGA